MKSWHQETKRLLWIITPLKWFPLHPRTLYMAGVKESCFLLILSIRAPKCQAQRWSLAYKMTRQYLSWDAHSPPRVSRTGPSPRWLWRSRALAKGHRRALGRHSASRFRSWTGAGVSALPPTCHRAPPTYYPKLSFHFLAQILLLPWSSECG